MYQPQHSSEGAGLGWTWKDLTPPPWAVDPAHIPPVGLREEDPNKYWNSTHTELTSHLDLHLTKRDLVLSLPACSASKEPNRPNEEPRELKTDTHGWVERKFSTASLHEPPNSHPWAFQQGMRSDLPYHPHVVEVKRSPSCSPGGRLWFKRRSALSSQEEGSSPGV